MSVAEAPDTAGAAPPPTPIVPVQTVKLRPVVGPPHAERTGVQMGRCRRQRRCMIGFLLCATAAAVAVLTLWLQAQPASPQAPTVPLSPPAPSASSFVAGDQPAVALDSAALVERVCVELAPLSGVVDRAWTEARRLVTGRHFAALDVDALRSAMVKLLPGDVHPSHVDIVDQGVSCVVCVFGKSDRVADDIIDAMLEADFLELVARELEAATVEFASAPTVTFTKPSIRLPPATPPRPQPLQPLSLRPPLSLSSLPPAPPQPVWFSDTSLVTINGGSDNIADDSVTDVVVWAGEAAEIQFAGDHNVFEYDYVFFAHADDGACRDPPVHDDLSGYLDGHLRMSVTVNPGIYHLCLRQGPVISYHPRVRLIAQHRPPSPPASSPSAALAAA